MASRQHFLPREQTRWKLGQLHLLTLFLADRSENRNLQPQSPRSQASETENPLTELVLASAPVQTPDPVRSPKIPIRLHGRIFPNRHRPFYGHRGEMAQTNGGIPSCLNARNCTRRTGSVFFSLGS